MSSRPRAYVHLALSMSSSTHPETAAEVVVVVVGCGISALTTAVHLLETFGSGRLLVGIYGDLTQLNQTTSCGCAGLWLPFHIEPQDKVRDWARTTYQRFLQDAENPDTGVRFVPAYQFYPKPPESLPYWHADVLDLAVIGRDQRPEVTLASSARTESTAVADTMPSFPDGYSYALQWRTAVVDMPRYLEWLVARFRRLGGIFWNENSGEPPLPLQRLTDVVRRCRIPTTNRMTIVVNATGLGARTLCADSELRPALGVLVRVRYPVRFVLQVAGGPLGDPQYPTYVIPRNEELCTCGGTVLFDLPAAEQERLVQLSTIADHLEPEQIPPIARDMLERCRQLYKPWQNKDVALSVAEVWSGLRPVRTGGVRLELERWPAAVEANNADASRWIIHNYGHGGGGVTVSWGCAAAVTELVRSLCETIDTASCGNA